MRDIMFDFQLPIASAFSSEKYYVSKLCYSPITYLYGNQTGVASSENRNMILEIKAHIAELFLELSVFFFCSSTNSSHVNLITYKTTGNVFQTCSSPCVNTVQQMSSRFN